MEQTIHKSQYANKKTQKINGSTNKQTYCSKLQRTTYKLFIHNNKLSNMFEWIQSVPQWASCVTHTQIYKGSRVYRFG